MPTTRTILGLEAEATVATYLQERGYRVLERNWRRPWGELDVIAEKAGVIHFVEVKASRNHVAGFEPFLRANSLKMTKVKRTARTWLAAHQRNPNTEWQMDVASVIMSPTPQIELFENV
jgi:putative endonuclease